MRVDDAEMFISLFGVFVDNMFPERNGVDKEIEIFSEFIYLNLIKFEEPINLSD